ncbi:uncharacterized protein N7483_000035 [Penicillium malachiteum]|uniref:uncharacterized protein n=1 Tax=Penicillium malachiteum TaxID=1324776 RepID=UPI0025497DEC|nr:uncharacterized protein N7483_000035 [Penicillium malachiteum]KAJ5734910.1 hypothetical protein N7483_000035 [Penicillium malachiteum]
MVFNTRAAFEEFKSVFPNKVITSDTKSEYQAAVAIPCNRQKTGSKFAIRTTGHNPNAGFSSADETAIVLDIRQLQSKELGSDGVARVGSGNTWGEVYTWLQGHNLSAIGGRDHNVGLGGLLLGGGLGASPNMHGLGVDGVKNFEVLLADGTLINANAKENTDLLRALKGGGPNFGIVTRFDLETHPLIKVKYEINLYKLEDHVEINKATAAVQEAMESDPKIGLFTNFNNGFAAVGLLYANTPHERPAVFAPFYHLQSLISAALPSTDGALLSLAQAMGHAQESKKRAISTVTTRVSQDLYECAYKAWAEVCKILPTDCVLHYTIQPFGKAAAQEGEDRGGNIMGHQGVAKCWWVFTCEWPESDSDDIVAQKAVATMAESVEVLAKEKGLLLEFKPMGFATGSQNVLGSYGAANLKQMREVAAKYDPEGLFQRSQYGGFLLRDTI